jgi:hypothetical protein
MSAFRFTSALVAGALLLAAAEDWRLFERMFVVHETAEMPPHETADLSVKRIMDTAFVDP